MVLRNIALFASGRADERFAIAHEVWPRLRKPEPLLLAGLFTDIAKGRGGDHPRTRRGRCARVLPGAPAQRRRHRTGLPGWWSSTCACRVTAQKQDISDLGRDPSLRQRGRQP